MFSVHLKHTSSRKLFSSLDTFYNTLQYYTINIPVLIIQDAIGLLKVLYSKATDMNSFFFYIQAHEDFVCRLITYVLYYGSAQGYFALSYNFRHSTTDPNVFLT